MKIRDVFDPLVDVLRVLAFTALDLLDGGRLLGRLLGNRSQLKVQHRWVALFGRGFV